MIKKILSSVVAVGMLCGTANATLIEVWQSGTGLFNISDADSLIASGGADYTSDYVGLIDFDDLGDGTQGFSALNIPWLGGVNTDFAARLTGSIDTIAGGLWGIFANHDDGVRISVNGVQIALFAGLTDNMVTGAFTNLNAGSNLIEIIFFEHGGGASLELYAAAGDIVNYPRDLTGLRTVPEPGTLALLGIGLIGMGLARRRKIGHRET